MDNCFEICQPKISVCQFKVTDDKAMNLVKANEYIRNSAKNGSDIIVLPECFASPYDVKLFDKYSEIISDDGDKSPSVFMLNKCSIDYPEVYIFSGSIIEKEDDKLYNTCLVFHKGKIIAKYRKNNLYKINLDEHSFCEGDVLTPGNEPTIVETKFGKIGIGICYDLRFPDLAKYYRENNCKIIIYPGSFNRHTGPKHWKLLQQTRALDNLLYVISCSTACSFGTTFESYGKSFIISPWADVINETKLDKEEVITSDLNIISINSYREMLPILS